MKKLISFVFLFAITYISVCAQDKSETAFVEATDSTGKLTVLPLKEIDAHVNIAGTIAEVTAKQVYRNTTSQTVQATYVFPGSTKAAVYGMKMTVGEREVIAKIMEKQEAQEQFDQAVEEGKTASLLKQHRPNVFEMNLGNIQPGETIIIELKYTELLTPVNGTYEFVYPTIVGERYDKELNKGETWTANPFTHLDQGNKPDFNLPKFNITVNLIAPMDLHGINVQSHKTKLEYKSRKEATISLDNGNQTENKDFILRYKLNGDEIKTGLMLFEGKDENFFLYMSEAPERITPKQIPPREYFFIVDVSGSMNGFPMDIAEDVMSNLLTGLQPTDKFNVMLFASSTHMLSKEALSVSPDNIKDAIEFIHEASQGGSGGTNMLSAIKRAFDQIDNNSSTSMVILTDGFITVEEEAFDYITNHMGEANFFPIGIGNHVNRHLIEGIAHVGHTEPLIITKKEEISRKSNRFREYVSSPVLTNIQVDFDEFETYDVLPSNVPDLLAEKPVVLFGKYKGEPSGKIIINGVSGDGNYSHALPVTASSLNENNTALRYLWARKKVQILDDYERVTYGSKRQEEITELGLKYNLLTKYTSFVAIDNQVDDTAHQPKHVQPSGAVPEPHEWLLIILMTLSVLYLLRDKISKFFIR